MGSSVGSSAVPSTAVLKDVVFLFELICTRTLSPSLSWPTVVLRSGRKFEVIGVSGAMVKT